VQNVVTYDAVLEVPNPDLRLKIGMTANVAFIEDQREDALRVPNAALRFRPTQAMGGRRRGADATASPGVSSAWGGRSERAASDSGSVAPAGEKDGARRERREGRGGKRVFVLEAENKLRPVRLKTGLSDGSFTEVVDGELKEGDRVVTGEEGANPSPAPRARQGGGTGGGRRGGGFL
jgi:HlyD family secretion protein